MRPMLDPALGALFRAVRAADGGAVLVVEGGTEPWASDTFEGGRHRLALRFTGDWAVERAARMAAALPEMEFTLSGHLVADVAEIEADGAELRLAALTVVDW